MGKNFPNSWSDLEPGTFKVRSQSYHKDRKKDFAPNHATYYPIGADLFLSQRKIPHIARFVDLPQISASDEAPAILVVNAQIKLADKQAALERMQWELMTSNKKVEQLQEEVNSTQGSLSSVLLFFDGLTKKDPTMIVDDYDVKPCLLDHLPHMDDWDDVEMQKMEEAREAYLAAVATAKENQDEESIVAAAKARQHLQSFVLGSDNGAVSPTSNGEYVHY